MTMWPFLGSIVAVLSFQKFTTGTISASSDLNAVAGNVVAIGVCRSDGSTISTPTGWTSVDKDAVDGSFANDEMSIAGFFRELDGTSDDDLAITGSVLVSAVVVSKRTGARALSAFNGLVDASTSNPTGNTVNGAAQTGPMLILGWGASRGNVVLADLTYTGATPDGTLEQTSGSPEGAAKYNFYPVTGVSITVDIGDLGGAQGVGSFGLLL